MRDDVISIGHPLVDVERLRRAIGHPHLDNSSDPRWPVTQGFDLLILNKNRVSAEPVPGPNRAIDTLGVAHTTEVRLRVGYGRLPAPVLQLTLKYPEPGLLPGWVGCK